jgi:hypothetical protein
MTYSYTGVITFSGSGLISPAGKTLSNNINVNAAGITVTLASNLTQGVNNTFTLTQGTLDLANYNLSTGSFSAPTSNVRTLSFGSGNINLTNTVAATTILSITNTTNFTRTGTGGFTRNMVATATVSLSGGASVATDLTITGGSSTLTFSSFCTLRNLNFTSSTCTASGNLSMYGDLTLSPGGTFAGINPQFYSSGVITSNGKTLGAVTINGVGVLVSLADNLTLNSSSALSLLIGTFDANNFSVTAGRFASVSSSARTLYMRSGTWTLTTSGASVWNISGLGLSLDAGTSTINMTSGLAKTFVGGGNTYYNLNQGGAGALTIVDSNTFNNITNTVQPATIIFTAGSTQFVSSFGLLGTAGNLITINSSSAGSPFFLSKPSGSVAVQYLAIQDSYAIGGAAWNAPSSTNTDLGNNTGWIFTATTGNFFLFL